MKFVQIIDFETERLDEMEQLLEEAARHRGDKKGGPTRRMLLKDRDNAHRHYLLVEFDSYEEAMRNSEDPETTKLAEQMGALASNRRFVNCDLLDARDLG
ncbi:hypothetical protein [Streptomyces sp. NPDC058739]|uniref:hypothetical protein n=1 Tax=Streptomyces sp. NPDC058739 TaxID=3346618 RepID=UPI0036960FA2